MKLATHIHCPASVMFSTSDAQCRSLRALIISKYAAVGIDISPARALTMVIRGLVELNPEQRGADLASPTKGELSDIFSYRMTVSLMDSKSLVIRV
jgi:hypothetical protein